MVFNVVENNMLRPHQKNRGFWARPHWIRSSHTFYFILVLRALTFLTINIVHPVVTARIMVMTRRFAVLSRLVKPSAESTVWPFAEMMLCHSLHFLPIVNTSTILSAPGSLFNGVVVSLCVPTWRVFFVHVQLSCNIDIQNIQTIEREREKAIDRQKKRVCVCCTI